jgi:hypothetical protein
MDKAHTTTQSWLPIVVIVCGMSLIINNFHMDGTSETVLVLVGAFFALAGVATLSMQRRNQVKKSKTVANKATSSRKE